MIFLRAWCNRQGSNLWPQPSQGCALPTELRLQILASRHSIEVQPFFIEHGFGDEIFLFSFFKKTSFIENSHFYEFIDFFCWEFFLWKIFLIFKILCSLFVTCIFSYLWIFISNIHLRRFFLVFGKFSSCCLFFYNSRCQSVTICHINRYKKIWSGGPGSNRHTRGLKPQYTHSIMLPPQDKCGTIV